MDVLPSVTFSRVSQSGTLTKILNILEEVKMEMKEKEGPVKKEKKKKGGDEKIGKYKGLELFAGQCKKLEDQIKFQK
jgi:hypothetical protein